MKAICFALDSSAAKITPKAILSSEWRCRRLHKPRVFQRVYLDSLDWRLLKRDRYLIADRIGDGFHLHLFDLGENRTIVAETSNQLPDFARSLPEGPLAAMLAPILQPRALVPQIRLAVERHSMAVLDGDNQTVAHLDLEVSKPQLEGAGGSTRVYRRLWFTPIKGYERQDRAIISALSDYGLPMLSAVIPVTDLISALNVDKSRFDARSAGDIHAADRCDRAVKHLLRSLLSVMEANRPPVVSDIDSECLHDFRVAVRHARSLLAQASGVLDQGRLEEAKSFFARLNKVTTAQRDLDVMLLNFDFYRSMLPARTREHLEPVHKYAVERRAAAAKSTARFVQSANYRQFVKAWRKYLDARVASRTSLIYAMKPVKDFADARIWRVCKRVIAQGKAIDDNSPPEALHSLRKRCKTLRHLVEFFSPLYPAGNIKNVMANLKRLQDNLGKFQDSHVHIGLLSDVRSALGKRGLLSPSVDAALTEVIRVLDGQQADCRKQFNKRFLEFSAERHQHLFKQLFRQ